MRLVSLQNLQDGERNVLTFGQRRKHRLDDLAQRHPLFQQQSGLVRYRLNPCSTDNDSEKLFFSLKGAYHITACLDQALVCALDPESQRIPTD